MSQVEHIVGLVVTPGLALRSLHFALTICGASYENGPGMALPPTRNGSLTVS